MALEGEVGRARRFQVMWHPAGLRVLARTEAFERFAFCGTQMLLLIYLAQQLAQRGGEGRIHGLTAVRQTFAAVFGATDDVGFASQFVATFAALVHLGPIAGAWIAQWAGRRLTIVCGGIMMTAGHLLLSLEFWLLPALCLLAIGAGCTISNKLTQVAALFDSANSDRAQGFATYTIALNFGAMMAPIFCGTLGEHGLWAWGFRAAALAMLLGVANYIAGWRHLPPDEIADPQTATKHLSGGADMTGLLLTCLLPYILAITVLNQAYMVALLWATTHVDRAIGGFLIPVTWVLVIDGIMSIIGVIVASAIWRRYEAKRPIREMHKLAIGCLVIALAYLVLAGAATLMASPLVLFVLFFVILDLGAAWLDAPMEAFVSRHATPARRSMTMALFKVSTAVAALLLGWLGRFYIMLGPAGFWLMNAGLAVGALVMALSLAVLVARVERRSATRGLGPDALPNLVVMR